ncbi:hypothetical protein [Aquimarina litoralis]|uniref:hypothetical protein n=1 Tax=Aquimarina litoralis TaxID=584605 RepID=UPI001C588337|nr:hypothetical protein [Aquimarina litoralis]MBW1296661.1 hypothetical protein [Aquimarina litoralis]
MKTLNLKTRLIKPLTTLAFCGAFLVVGCSKDSVEAEISPEEIVQTEESLEENLEEDISKGSYAGSVDSKWYYSPSVGNNYVWVKKFRCNTKSKRNQVKKQRGKAISSIKKYIKRKKGCSCTGQSKRWGV